MKPKRVSIVRRAFLMRIESPEVWEHAFPAQNSEEICVTEGQFDHRVSSKHLIY
jgi:hypothetical protein